MQVSDELLWRVRKYHRPAIETLFQLFYPCIHRVAAALTGRQDVARGVVRFVIGRAFHAIPSWKDQGAPQRWFSHHTVLTTRRARKYQPDPQSDLLVQVCSEQSAGYIAFIRAIRHLPFQQREAFLLHHGENWGLRQLGVAMDCSTEAAGNHLRVATEALQQVAESQLQQFIPALVAAYGKLSPAEELMLPQVRSYVARHIWPRRILRAIFSLLTLLLLAGLVYVCFWLYQHVRL